MKERGVKEDATIVFCMCTAVVMKWRIVKEDENLYLAFPPASSLDDAAIKEHDEVVPEVSHDSWPEPSVRL